NEGACRGELFFVKHRVWRMTAIAHGFKGSIDLTERDLSHGGIPPPLCEEHQRNTFIPKTRAPLKRHALARPFLQRLAKGRDRLPQPRSAAPALTERCQRIAEVVLRHGPVERHALARPFLQRVAKGRDRLLQPRRPALALAELLKPIAEIVLRHG